MEYKVKVVRGDDPLFRWEYEVTPVGASGWHRGGCHGYSFFRGSAKRKAIRDIGRIEKAKKVNEAQTIMFYYDYPTKSIKYVDAD